MNFKQLAVAVAASTSALGGSFTETAEAASVDAAKIKLVPHLLVQPSGPVAQLGPPHVLSPAFFGVNVDNVYISNFSLNDPAFKKALTQDGFKNLRFPSGDFSSYYNWKTGWLWPNFVNNCVGGTNASLPPNTDSVSNFSVLSHSTKTYPLFTLNILTQNVTNVNGDGAFISPKLSQADLSLAQQYQISMLMSASSKGLSVPFVELGNEAFWGSSPGCPDNNIDYPTGADYAKQMNSWISAVRVSYPTTQIAAVGAIAPGGVTATPGSGSWETREQASKISNWNIEVLENIRGINALTLHRYDEATSDSKAEDNLSIVFSDWSAIQKNTLPALAAKGLQAWFTEFSGFSDFTGNLNNEGGWTKLPVYTGTWLRGLYDAEMAVQFLSDPRVGQVSFYNITDTYFQTPNQLYWENGNPPPNASVPNGGIVRFNNPKAGGLTAIGQAYNLVGRAIAGAKVAYQTSFSGMQFVHVTPPNPGDVSNYPAVTGVWLKPDSTVTNIVSDTDPFPNTIKSGTWLVLNLSDQQQKLPYSDKSLGTLESLWSPSLMTVVNSDASLEHKTSQFKKTSSITLPPYSVNLVTTYKSTPSLLQAPVICVPRRSTICFP